MVESPSSAVQSRARLVVVGGGISGTAAAWTAAKEAAKRGLDVETLLLEKETVLGGKASAIREDGWLFETGPLGYLNNEPIVDELVRGAGLEEGQPRRSAKTRSSTATSAASRPRMRCR